MYEIFEIRGGHAFPSVMALRTPPYKDIWENDTSEDKGEAIRVFDYINFMCNPVKSNKFYGYNEEERAKHVKKQVWGDSEQPTTLDMMNGCIAYKEDMRTFSPTYATLEAARGTLDGLKNFYRGVDFDERTGSGAMVHKPKDLLAGINELDKTVSNFEALRSKVIEELNNSNKTMSDREIGAYED